MDKKTININGVDFTIEQLEALIENAKNVDPIAEVYTYHKTTAEEFDKKYEGIPDSIKATAQLELITEFYNKGEKIDWDNDNQKNIIYGGILERISV